MSSSQSGDSCAQVCGGTTQAMCSGPSPPQNCEACQQCHDSCDEVCGNTTKTMCSGPSPPQNCEACQQCKGDNHEGSETSNTGSQSGSWDTSCKNVSYDKLEYAFARQDYSQLPQSCGDCISRSNNGGCGMSYETVLALQTAQHSGNTGSQSGSALGFRIRLKGMKCNGSLNLQGGRNHHTCLGLLLWARWGANGAYSADEAVVT